MEKRLYSVTVVDREEKVEEIEWHTDAYKEKHKGETEIVQYYQVFDPTGLTVLFTTNPEEVHPYLIQVPEIEPQAARCDYLEEVARINDEEPNLESADPENLPEVIWCLRGTYKEVNCGPREEIEEYYLHRANCFYKRLVMEDDCKDTRLRVFKVSCTREYKDSQYLVDEYEADLEDEFFF